MFCDLHLSIAGSDKAKSWGGGLLGVVNTHVER